MMIFHFLSLLLLLWVSPIYSSPSPWSNRLDHLLSNFSPSRSLITYATPQRYWYNRLKADIKRFAYGSVVEKMVLPEYRPSLNPIFDYILGRDRFYYIYTVIFDKLVSSDIPDYDIINIALKAAVRNGRVDCISSRTSLPVLFHNVMSVSSTDDCISSIRQCILSIYPFIEYNSCSVLQYALMTGDVNIFNIIPRDIRYFLNKTLEIPKLLDSFTHENALEALNQIFILEFTNFQDALSSNQLMISYINLLKRFNRNDLLNSSLDTLIAVYSDRVEDLNYIYIFHMCYFVGNYDVAQKILTSSPETTKDKSSVLHVAIQLEDHVLFSSAPENKKYMSVLDSNNKYPSDYVSSENGHYYCLRRLAVEYLGSDNLYFYPRNILYLSGINEDESSSPLSTNESHFNLLPQNVPIEFVESESEYLPADEYECLENSSNDTISVFYNNLYDFVFNSSNAEASLDDPLILNLYSLANYYCPSINYNFFFKCLKRGAYDVIEVVVKADPSFKIEGLNIFQLALKHDNENLLEIVPKNIKYLNDIDESLVLITKSSSFDLFLSRLTFEYQGIDLDLCNADTVHLLLKDNILTDLFYEVSLRFEKHDLIFLILKVAHKDFQDKFWRIVNDILNKEYFDFLKAVFEGFAKDQVQVLPIHYAVTHNNAEILKALPDSEVYLSLKDSDEYDLTSASFDGLDVSKIIPDLLVSILRLTVRYDRFAHFIALLTCSLETHPDLVLDGLFLNCIDSATDKFEFIQELIKHKPLISHNGQTVLHFGCLLMNHKLLDLVPAGIEYSEFEVILRNLLKDKPVISALWFRSFVQMVLRCYSNLELFENLTDILKFCFENIDLLLINDPTDLQLSKTLLELFKQFNATSKPSVKILFYDSCKDKRYKIIRRLLEIDPRIQDFEDRNILHLFAIFKDKNLFDLIPQDKDSIYCHRLDSNRMTPIDYITDDYGVLHLLRNRLAREYTNSHCDFNFNELFLKLNFYSRMCDKSDLKERLVKVFSKINVRSGIVTLRIDRSNVLRSTMAEIKKISSVWFDPNLYPNVRIKFNDEAGVDSGGLRAEWYSLLVESFFKTGTPDDKVEDYTAPLFIVENEESGLYSPNNLYSPDDFKIAGSILSLAFANKFTIGVEFIESFYRKLFGFNPVNSDYLRFHSPALYKQLYPLLSLDKMSSIDPFNDDTQTPKQYFESAVYDSMYGKHRERIDSMVEGFMLSRNGLIIQELTIEQFKFVLSGKSHCSPSEFLDNCVFNGYRGSDLDTFKNIVKGFDSKQMTLLIKFTTGRNLLPYNGIKGLSSRIEVIFNANSKDHYPTAATCFNKLRIPTFTTAQELKEKLLFAFRNENGSFGRQ